MQLRFYIEPETGAPHIYEHGVFESEVAEVLENAGEDRAARDGARLAIGHTLSGRLLRVVYVPDPQPNSYFVVTAFELRGKAALAYRRRRRKKRR
jgi:hypothetical protein